VTRAVFFDVDGVLVHGYHSRPELQRRWDENLLADLGIDPEEFKNRFIFDVFVKKVLLGKVGLVEALDLVLPQLGYKGPTQRIVSYWLEHDSQLNVELVDVVRRLKASGCKLYIATNQEHLRAQWLWQTLRLGEVFDDMFYAARLGIMKPEPRYFDEVERRIGPQSQPPLFFDDTEKVVAGARKAGWEAVVFNTSEDCTGHPWIAERLALAPSS
jgi:putative hydrolase of the HAD superfamily